MAQQLALGRARFAEYCELLGYPISPGRRRVLYLAMDRPRQAARSFRRMVGEAWRSELDERLSVWAGPPPLDLAKNPALLTALCADADADTVIIDSLKDAAIGLSDDEVGAAWNRARQHALAAGVELIELHHPRKALNGGRVGHLSVDDLYGSTWISSGAGSILMLTGNPGDPIVGLRHIKQPMDEVGPFQVLHNADTGRTTIWHSTDLLAVIRARKIITAKEAAAVMFDTDAPTSAQTGKGRRRLDGLLGDGLLRIVQDADEASQQPTLYGAVG